MHIIFFFGTDTAKNELKTNHFLRNIWQTFVECYQKTPPRPRRPPLWPSARRAAPRAARVCLRSQYGLKGIAKTF